jgi:hypothetical protein
MKSIARAHHAAGHDHLAVGVAAQEGGHVQVVGQHAQAAVVLQRAGDCLGGGADVQDQRAVVGHLGRHGARDARLALGVERLALGVGQVLDGGAGHAHAAVEALDQPLLGQALHVAAHGL